MSRIRDVSGCGKKPTPRLVVCAQRLCCHPNTVPYRLQRIEKRTGLSHSRPRDIAELCLAFEVHRRLI
ncbi:helix-turn-helix domain-containing protein [Mycobacterium cookii]|uniref:helix-turn-helix domain-containing protein n=1 Tax=Mycobacterium cookii TaxID=1775 RepID=UPI003558552E